MRSNSLQAGRFGFLNPVEAKEILFFRHPSGPVVGSNQLPVKWVLGFFLGVRWLRRGAGHKTHWSEKAEKSRMTLLFTSCVCVEIYEDNVTLHGTADSPQNIYSFWVYRKEEQGKYEEK